jgi:predicted nucleic acid-binding protein
MAAYFLDSSALIKRYVQERGTAWVRALTDPVAGHQIFVTRLAAVEIAATLWRQARAGNLPAAEAALGINLLRHAFAHEFRVVEITPLLASHALNHIQSHALRGADALHLGAATELQRRRANDGLPSLAFICSDAELNRAAVAEGLVVEDPNNHP